MTQDSNHLNEPTFSPTQEDLDKLCVKLNQRFYNDEIRRLSRELEEWQSRHSFWKAFKTIRPEFGFSRDIKLIWLPVILVIWLAMLVVLVVKVIFLPLSLLLILIRRWRTPKPTAECMPMISLPLSECSTFPEIKSRVDKFIADQGGRLTTIRNDELLELGAEISQRLNDPKASYEKALRTSFRQLKTWRTAINSRRWYFLFPPTAEQIAARRSRRINFISPPTKEAIDRKDLDEALAESGLASQETRLVSSYLLKKINEPTEEQPPLLMFFEYHELTAPRHSVTIRLSIDRRSVTISKYAPDEALIAVAKNTPKSRTIEQEYCESDTFKVGSFSRSPNNLRWRAFNNAILELNRANKLSSSKYKDETPWVTHTHGPNLAENAADKTIWTLFVHYGNHVILSGDSTRGPIGHEVASAIAKLIC